MNKIDQAGRGHGVSIINERHSALRSRALNLRRLGNRIAHQSDVQRSYMQRADREKISTLQWL